MYSVEVIINDATVAWAEGDLTEAKTRSSQYGTDGTRVLAQGIFVLHTRQKSHLDVQRPHQRLNKGLKLVHTQSKPSAHWAVSD